MFFVFLLFGFFLFVPFHGFVGFDVLFRCGFNICEVFLELYKGNATVTGRTSPISLYDHQVASMEDDQGAYEPSDATGFIRLHGLPMVQHRRRLADTSEGA